MNVSVLTSSQELDHYAEWITPQGNLWQSLERKQYLEALGKEVRIYVVKQNNKITASALVVIDTTTAGYSTWEIPRGPVGPLGMDNGERIKDKAIATLLEQIAADAKKDKCIAMYLSPLSIIHYPLSILRSSLRHIHCEATRIVDLMQSEEEILAQMKQKGRYNIKVAQKHGITVTESDDIDAFYTLVTQTGQRDGFTHLPKKQYQAFLEHLPGAFLLLAYDKNTEPIAGVLSVVWGKRAIYYYGASNHAHRAKMAPYMLQWESMRYAKERGCTTYDLLGVAPQSNEKRIKDNKKSFIHYPLSIIRSCHRQAHPWAGITSFKEKFGGQLVAYPKEQVIILKPLVYQALRLKRMLFG